MTARVVLTAVEEDHPVLTEWNAQVGFLSQVIPQLCLRLRVVVVDLVSTVFHVLATRALVHNEPSSLRVWPFQICPSCAFYLYNLVGVYFI